jgi:Asp/Glu/hydantoin racemase
MKLILLTPNADPTIDLGQELAAYVSMLLPQVPDIEIGHAVIDRGPLRLETDDDVLAAAPEIVRKAGSLARKGADAVIIDCMSEPGLTEAQRSVRIPVIGPRSAVLAAAGGVPVTFVRDEAAARQALAEGARLLSLSSTGLTGLAALLQATLGVRVLDPLPVAFWEAVRGVRTRP